MCSLPFNPLLRNPLLNAQGFKHPAKSRRTVKKLLGQGVYESDSFYVLSRPPAVVGGGCDVFRLGMGEVFGEYVVGRAPPGPGGLSTECLQTMENDSQKRVPTRRKKAPVAEPKVQRPEWVGYHENYVEKLTVKSFVTR